VKWFISSGLINLVLVAQIAWSTVSTVDYASKSWTFCCILEEGGPMSGVSCGSFFSFAEVFLWCRGNKNWVMYVGWCLFLLLYRFMAVFVICFICFWLLPVDVGQHGLATGCYLGGQKMPFSAAWLVFAQAAAIWPWHLLCYLEWIIF